MNIPDTFEHLKLVNRLNRPVQVGFRRVCHEGRELVFLAGDNPAVVSKNFETFAGQIVREFDLEPAQVEFIELRGAEEQASWYRWQAHWVGSAPMECVAEPVKGESGRRFLSQVLERDVVAA